MKFVYSIFGIGVLIIIAAVVFVTRYISNELTAVEVIEPEVGVHCAKMVTADGAAIACWKTGE